MIKEALQYLLSLAAVQVIEKDGVTYTSERINRVCELEATRIESKSLASIVQLVLNERKHSRISDLKIIIHVISPTSVAVATSLAPNLNRVGLYTAVAEAPNLRLEAFRDLEAMNISLKSCFLPTEDREKVIAILGNIKEEIIKTSSDDGFSQSATVKTGIATLSNVTIPSVVKLKPYRTFNEVEQPESEFLLRLQNGPQAALFEADGGAWKIEARQNIKKYFEEQLKAEIESGEIVVTE